MRLKVSKNTITFLIGALVLMVVVFGGLFWLQRSALDQASRTLKAREAELNDGKRVAARQAMADQLLEQDRQQIRFLESGVSNAAYVPTLLKQLEDLASGTHNKVLGVRPTGVTKAPSRLQQRRDPDAQGDAAGDDKKEKAPEEPYTRLVIEVNLIGTFQSSQQFVSRLMRFPKIVAVDELQLQPHRAAGPKDPSGQLDVRLKLTAFVMKENTPAAHVTTASAAIGGIN